jgi:1,4-alpha-glucan branching enzyme
VDSHGILDAEMIEGKNDIGLNTNFGYNLETGVSVFGRNKNTSRQVWDAQIGYPGDASYREFHKKDHQSGLHYWRITDKTVGKEEKELYNIKNAREKVESQANHFVSLMSDELQVFQEKYGKQGIIVSPYDFELYGHWWMEGIAWLKRVFELIYNNENVEMITISDYVSQYKSQFSTIRMKESSWGEGGHFQVWKNKEHGWIWQYLNPSIKDLENVLEMHPNPDGWGLRILKQTARELLLMEGSDWPFLLYTTQAKEYANQRFHVHHQGFNKLIWAAKNLEEKFRISLRELEEMELRDSCFQDINLDYFRKK